MQFATVAVPYEVTDLYSLPAPLIRTVLSNHIQFVDYESSASMIWYETVRLLDTCQPACLCVRACVCMRVCGRMHVHAYLRFSDSTLHDILLDYSCR